MPYLTAEKLTAYLPEIEKGLVSKIGELLNKERNGSRDCGDLFAQIEFAMDDYKYFSQKYVPPGTATITAVNASCNIDFSTFDPADLANGMQIVVTTTIDGVVYQLADFTGDFYEVSLATFLAAIASEINGGTTGFLASNDSTSLTIVCPVDLGALPNGIIVSVQFAPYYAFTQACLAESGVGVGSPGWTGITYSAADGNVYAVNKGGTKKSYWWNGVGSVATPPPPTGSLAQCSASTGSNNGIAYNYNDNKLYIGSADFAPPLVNVNNVALGLTCGVTLNPVIPYAAQFYARLYNPNDGCVYFGTAGGSIPGMYKRDEFGNYTLIPLGVYAGPSAEYIYFPNQMAAEPITGKVWVLGVHSPNTHYGFAIADGLAGPPSSQVVATGTIASGLDPKAIVYIDSTEQMAIVFSTVIHFYDLTGTLVSTQPYTIPGGATIESIIFDSVNEKILIGYSNTSVHVLNVDGSADTIFDVTGLIAGTISGLVMTPSGNLYAAISDVPNSELFIAKMEYTSLGSGYSGTFEGGITQEVWEEEQNCLTDDQANSQFEELQTWLGVSNCAVNTVPEVNPLSGILGSYRFLGTEAGAFITTLSGAYIAVN